jgi:hypothetical protein
MKKGYLIITKKLLVSERIISRLKWPSIIGLFSIFGNVFLSNKLISQYYLVNSNSYIDLHTYIEKAKNFHLENIIPLHYYLRIVVPSFTLVGVEITENLWLYSFYNLLLTYISIFIFLKGFTKFLKFNFENKKLLFMTCFLSITPGIIFTNVSMKPEWPTILIVGLIFLLLKQKKLIYKMLFLPLSLFVRPSIAITSIYLYIFPEVKNSSRLFSLLIIIPILTIALAFLGWKLCFGSNFFHSAYYNPIPRELELSELRDYFSIKSPYELWKAPIKVLYALILESNFDAASKFYINPENLNNLSGISRIVSFFLVLYLYVSKKIKLLFLKRVIWIYFLLVMPSICLIGFYQTRYFVAADLILYTYIFIILSQLCKKKLFVD